MKVSENEIQRQIVDWIRYVAPECMVVAIPNGSRRTFSGRAANAVPGLTPGAPDLVVIRPNGGVLWLEVKSEKGYASENQIRFHGELHIRGHVCALVRSIEEVRLAFNHVGIKTREV